LIFGRISKLAYVRRRLAATERQDEINGGFGHGGLFLFLID